MDAGLFNRIPLMPLFLLWLTYALLGWDLSAHHIIWLVGIFVAAVVLAVLWKSNSWLDHLIRFGSQTLILVLILTTSVALVATWSLLLNFFLMPFATTILANIEMRFAGFNKLDRFLILSLLAGFGLAVGETIDLVIVPSSRY